MVGQKGRAGCPQGKQKTTLSSHTSYQKCFVLVEQQNTNKMYVIAQYVQAVLKARTAQEVDVMNKASPYLLVGFQ